jgi:competence protein ComGC
MREQRQTGFTLIEALVLIAVVCILLALVPYASPRKSAQARRVACTSNLKQVGLGLRLFANDHGGKLPWLLSTNNGGSRELAMASAVFAHFAAASNELVTPKILRCPADKERMSAESFPRLSNHNLSYFVSVDAELAGTNTAPALMTGDRNISGGTSLSPWLQLVSTNSEMTWTKDIHQQAGNIGFNDGSVLRASASTLRRHVSTTNTPVHLAIP